MFAPPTDSQSCQVIASANGRVRGHRASHKAAPHFLVDGFQWFELNAQVGAVLPVFLDNDRALRVLNLCMLEDASFQRSKRPLPIDTLSGVKNAAHGLRQTIRTLFVRRLEVYLPPLRLGGGLHLGGLLTPTV